MFTTICVVGAGRLGSAAHARLAERVPSVRLVGRDLACGDPDLVLLCVPDRAIEAVARAIPEGPWIAHTSGATGLDALAPHRRRFSLHPLQTFQRGLGGAQFDGAYAAVSGESRDALAAGFALAAQLGLQPFELADADRPVYHAAATVAASFLVTLHAAAAELMDAARAPREALGPLMRRTTENGFEPTGPFVRRDLGTIEAHVRAIRARRPQLEPAYRVLADLTERLASAARSADDARPLQASVDGDGR